MYVCVYTCKHVSAVVRLNHLYLKCIYKTCKSTFVVLYLRNSRRTALLDTSIQTHIHTYNISICYVAY